MCRLRNIVADVPRELLKITPELHEHAPLEAAAVQIKFPCYQQVVRGADLPYDRSHEAFPGHNRLTLTAIARGVCRRWLLL